MQPKEAVQWRVIPLQDCDVHTMHSMEEAICESVARKISSPTIMFSRVLQPAISLAYNQNIKDVDLELCNRIGVHVARRSTGGRAMFLSPHYLIINVIGRPEHFGVGYRNVTGLYAAFCDRVVCSLQDVLNVPVRIVTNERKNENNNIVANDKKIGGVAQLQTKDYVLVHGYIRHEKPGPLEFQFLRFKEQPLAAYFPYINTMTTGVTEQRSLGFNDFYEKFFSLYLKGVNYKVGVPSSEEFRMSQHHQKQHLDHGWLQGRADYPSKGHCDQTSINFSLEPS